MLRQVLPESILSEQWPLSNEVSGFKPLSQCHQVVEIQRHGEPAACSLGRDPCCGCLYDGCHIQITVLGVVSSDCVAVKFFR